MLYSKNENTAFHFGWVVLAATFYINLIVDGYCFAFGIIRLYIEEEYPTYPTWMIAIIGGLVPIIYLILAPICIAINEFVGPTRVVICASVISTTSFLLAWINAYLQVGFWFDLFMLGIFQGISSALLYGPSIAFVGQYFPLNQRALAVGITTCGSSIGAIFYGIIIPPLFDTFGWRGSLAIFACFNLNGCVCAMAFLNSLKPKLSPQPQKSQITIQYFHKHEQLHSPDLPPFDVLPTVPTPPVSLTTFSGEGDGCNTPIPERPPDDRDDLPIPPCFIMQKILEDKLRSRLDTNHSLDNAIITRDNVLIKIKQNQQTAAGVPSLQREHSRSSEKGKRRINQEAKKKKPPDEEELRPSASSPDAEDGELPADFDQSQLPPSSLTAFFKLLKKYFIADFLFQRSFLYLLGAAAFSIVGYYYISTLLVTAQSHNPKWGVTARVQNNLLLIFGIFNTFGRGISGRLADFGLKCKYFTSYWLFIIGNGLSAFLLLIFPKFMHKGDNAFILFAICYGFFIAPLVTMRSVIVSDMYGEENANASFGWFLFIQGVVQIFGIILPTWLDTMSVSYAYGCGAACFFGSCFFVYLTQESYFKTRNETIQRHELRTISSGACRNAKKRYRV